MISGLMNTSGLRVSSFFDKSMMMTRLATPTWMPASPMPGAAYMVSNISSTSLRRLASMRLTGSDTSRSRLSGSFMISRTVMAGDLSRA